MVNDVESLMNAFYIFSLLVNAYIVTVIILVLVMVLIICMSIVISIDTVVVVVFQHKWSSGSRFKMGIRTCDRGRGRRSFVRTRQEWQTVKCTSRVRGFYPWKRLDPPRRIRREKCSYSLFCRFAVLGKTLCVILYSFLL